MEVNDNIENILLQILPREILACCFSKFAEDYYYGDLWRIGLVSKLFYEQTIAAKDQFQKYVRRKLNFRFSESHLAYKIFKLLTACKTL